MTTPGFDRATIWVHPDRVEQVAARDQSAFTTAHRLTAIDIRASGQQALNTFTARGQWVPFPALSGLLSEDGELTEVGEKAADRCQVPDCANPATHGSGGEATSCMWHAGRSEKPVRKL